LSSRIRKWSSPDNITITNDDEPFAAIWVNPLKAECDV
jgi:hypothetical protein